MEKSLETRSAGDAALEHRACEGVYELDRPILQFVGSACHEHRRHLLVVLCDDERGALARDSARMQRPGTCHLQEGVDSRTHVRELKRAKHDPEPPVQTSN